ncbi:MAG: EamA family transporter [archaeon]|nr:EamA family transporter [archaeon]
MLVTAYLLAIILAVGSSICFAGNRAFASKPLLNFDPRILTYITLLTGVITTAGALVISGQVATLLLASAFVLAIFAIVGIVHYAIGRQLSYMAVKNIGANASSPLLASSVLYSLVFSVLFLQETVTFLIGIGTALILTGVLVLEIRSSVLKRHGKYKTGYLAAILTAAIFGLTPVAISFGLSIYDYYFAAVFISYASATVIYTLTANAPKMFRGIVKTPSATLILCIISSIFASGAQLFRFAALSFAPVVLVAPILSTNPIFTIVMTRLVAKEVEVFRLRTIVCIIIVVIGGVLVSISA